MSPSQLQAEIALRFARALASGEFDLAHSLLGPPLNRMLTPAELKARFEEMISYGDGPPDHVEAMNTFETWPTRQSDEVGWVYVAINGPSYSEAVVVVVGTGGLIQELEWGRP